MTKSRTSSRRAPRLRPLWRRLDEVDGDRPPSRLDASSLLCASMGECAAMCESATSAAALSAASGCVRPTHIEQDYFTAGNPPVGAFICSPLLSFRVRVSSSCSLGARATAWARSPISSTLPPGARLLVFSVCRSLREVLLPRRLPLSPSFALFVRHLLAWMAPSSCCLMDASSLWCVSCANLSVPSF